VRGHHDLPWWMDRIPQPGRDGDWWSGGVDYSVVCSRG
jgi:hypothetical protein